MRIFVLTANYELRVSRKSHLPDHPFLRCLHIIIIILAKWISGAEQRGSRVCEPVTSEVALCAVHCSIVLMHHPCICNPWPTACTSKPYIPQGTRTYDPSISWGTCGSVPLCSAQWYELSVCLPLGWSRKWIFDYHVSRKYLRKCFQLRVITRNYDVSKCTQKLEITMSR
jgi:hypothetical protein